MNNPISLLLICLLSFPALLTAQNRRAPDACPGMNNKKPTGEYPALSKRSGQNSSFSSPKYQYLYAKNRYQATASAATKEKSNASSTRSKGTEKEEAEFVKPAEKNSSSKATRTEKEAQKGKSRINEPEESPVIAPPETGEENEPVAVSPVKAPDANPSAENSENRPYSVNASDSEPEGIMLNSPDANKTEKTAAAKTTKRSEEKTAAIDKADSDKSAYTKYSGDKSSYAKTAADKSGSAKNKKASTAKASEGKRKKTCFGKKSADSCPEF